VSSIDTADMHQADEVRGRPRVRDGRPYSWRDGTNGMVLGYLVSRRANAISSVDALLGDEIHFRLTMTPIIVRNKHAYGVRDSGYASFGCIDAATDDLSEIIIIYQTRNDRSI